MPGQLRKRERRAEADDAFDWFDRMFEDWSRMLPFRRPMTFPRQWSPGGAIRVDEYREDGALVVRADLAGIDPDKDVEITVADGMLHIQAERREEEHAEEKGYLRRELRYGSFERVLPLPSGVKESDITANYRNGILEIRVPAAPAEQATKIPVAKE